VTASEEARIDIAANGKIERALGHTGTRDCPGMRKSVRFQISGPVSIQISNAASRTLDLAIAPAN
jgi:hypothetical protein